MIRPLVFCIMFFVILEPTFAKNIRILNWWDYLDNRILQKLAKNGIPAEIIEYRSNDVAMSKIASRVHDYDIAIISNINRLSAESADLVEPTMLNDLFSKRAATYDKRLVGLGRCIPFMWSSTVFSFDSRVIKQAPLTIQELIDLKTRKLKVGIIDDPYEVALRLILDRKECSDRQSFASCAESLSRSAELKPEDFVTSIEQIIPLGNFAAYGWHGEVAMHMSQYEWVKAVPALRHPVLGVDYVCVLKGKRTKKRIDEIIKTVELLTDQESIRWNVEKTQYFSPYKDDIVGLHPRVIELYKKITSKYNDSAPVLIYPPDYRSLKIINTWWKNVRYPK